MKKSLVILVIIVVSFVFFAVGVGGTYYYLNRQKEAIEEVITPTEVPQPSVAIELPTAFPTVEPATESQTAPTSAAAEIPAGWETYQNNVHGFSISYPPEYNALDDSKNLYGWANGIVLLYKGGQSYDLAVQVWNTQADFDNRTNVGLVAPVTVAHNGKIYSFDNLNNDPEVDAIVATIVF